MSNNDIMSKFRKLLDKKKGVTKHSNTEKENSELNREIRESGNDVEKNENSHKEPMAKIEHSAYKQHTTINNDIKSSINSGQRNSVTDLILKFNKQKSQSNFEKESNDQGIKDTQRNSTNKDMIQKSLKSVQSEMKTEDTQIKSDNQGLNVATNNQQENQNIINDNPGMSVKELVKTNQRTVISNSKNSKHIPKKNLRHSTKNNYQFVNNISKYLEALENSKANSNVQKTNEIPRFERDISVQDLANIYENKLTETKIKMENQQKRNTVAYNPRGIRMEGVDENHSQEEENFSDGSFSSNYEHVNSNEDGVYETLYQEEKEPQFQIESQDEIKSRNLNSKLEIHHSDININPQKNKDKLIVSNVSSYNFSPEKKDYNKDKIMEQSFNFELKSKEINKKIYSLNEEARLSFISNNSKMLKNSDYLISRATEMKIEPKEKRYTISMNSNIDYIPTENFCNASDLNIKQGITDREELQIMKDNLNFNRVNDERSFINEKLLHKENKLLKNFYSTNANNSKYQKNIINSLDMIAVTQYNIHSSIPLDSVFLDVICINCYECVKFSEVDIHSETCVTKPEDTYREQQEEDYNARIFKMHESLKKKHAEIYKTNDQNLIIIYEELTSLIYEILINNNSIEELDRSITRLNEILNNKLVNVNSHYKLTLIVFGKRVSQLVFNKLQDMEKILLCVQDEDSFEDEEINVENEQRVKLLKLELADLEKQTQNTKYEIEQWRKESKFLENMLRKPNLNSEMLSEIQSDVLSRKDESFDCMTMVTGQTSEYDASDVANMKDVNEVMDNEEVAKKYFLTVGLNLKFKWGEKIRDNVSIADLYEKARSNNIPPSEWQNFITRALGV